MFGAGGSRSVISRIRVIRPSGQRRRLPGPDRGRRGARGRRGQGALRRDPPMARPHLGDHSAPWLARVRAVRCGLSRFRLLASRRWARVYVRTPAVPPDRARRALLEQPWSRRPRFGPSAPQRVALPGRTSSDMPSARHGCRSSSGAAASPSDCPLPARELSSRHLMFR
jgi:hypothetical protein